MKRSFAYAWTHSERLYDGAICLCVHRHIGLCLAYAWIGSALARDFGMCAGAPGKRHAGGRLRRDCPSRPRGRGCPAWLSRAWPSRTGAPKVTETAESRIFVGQISTSAHIDGWPTHMYAHAHTDTESNSRTHTGTYRHIQAPSGNLSYIRSHSQSVSPCVRVTFPQGRPCTDQDWILAQCVRQQRRPRPRHTLRHGHIVRRRALRPRGHRKRRQLRIHTLIVLLRHRHRRRHRRRVGGHVRRDEGDRSDREKRLLGGVDDSHVINGGPHAWTAVAGRIRHHLGHPYTHTHTCIYTHTHCV
jgi:hypothetical protein